MSSGNIPVLNVVGDTIPRAYERAIKEVWEKGASIRTEYDRPEDPPSRDATVMITVPARLTACRLMIPPT